VHELPAGLPAQLYLLAYDSRKRRLVQNMGFPYLIRAAALTELLLSGRIVEEDGKPRAVPDAPPVDDPVLAGLLEKIAASKPRSWQRWVHQDTRATLKAVRDELEAKRWIKVELRRPFLIFRRTLIHVRDPRVVTRLKAKVHTALSAPLTRVDDRDAALVALAAAGDHPALSRREKRTHKARIAELAERGGPAGPALRKILKQTNTAVVAAVSG